jgi:hypothetical protein
MFRLLRRSAFAGYAATAILAAALDVESAAAATNVVGAWETSAQHDGMTFAPFGDVEFYNYQHRCPVAWAKFVAYGDDIRATELETRKVHLLSMISSSELRDNLTGFVYHRVSNVEFKANPKGC